MSFGVNEMIILILAILIYLLKLNFFYSESLVRVYKTKTNEESKYWTVSMRSCENNPKLIGGYIFLSLY